MGCHLSMFHEEWFTDPGPDDLWKRILAADPEMKLIQTAQVTALNGEVTNFKAKGLAVWTKYSGTERKGPAFFYINKGRIVVHNADKEILHKTMDLAHKLKAKVEDMDGSIYEGHGDKITIKQAHKADKKAWWHLDQAAAH